MPMLGIEDIDLQGKRTLIREDFNVPMHGGRITNDRRIRAAVPTIQYALQAGAKVHIIGHLGRPQEGLFSEQYSLAPVAKRLEELLSYPVRLIKEPSQAAEAEDNVIILWENCRFYKGEKANDASLAHSMAAQCDVFIMDAFAVAHRSQASTCGLAQYAPIACAGPLLLAELAALQAVMEAPKPPLVAIVGGAKVSTKLNLLQKVMERGVDQLIVGGGIANTFLAAAGFPVGDSLYERDLMPQAAALIEQAQIAGKEIVLPIDVVVARQITPDAPTRTTAVAAVGKGEKILDVGIQTITDIRRRILAAGTLLWNGPLGLFELPPFAEGTRALSAAIAESTVFSVAGGGDTIAAIDCFGIADAVSYISTGGGAFLALLEGQSLPVIRILEARKNAYVTTH